MTKYIERFEKHPVTQWLVATNGGMFWALIVVQPLAILKYLSDL